MSKNFELEYKAYIDEIKPDLWNKIAGQLPERSQITEDDKAVAELVSFPTTKNAEEKVVQMPAKRKWYRYSGIVAACLCVAILVPVYVTNREQMRKDSQANAYDSQSSTVASDVAVDVDVNKIVAGNKEMSVGFVNLTGVVDSIDGNQVTITIQESNNVLLSKDSTITVVISEDMTVEENESYFFELKKDKDGFYTVIDLK